MKRLIKGEKGQAMVLVLILLIVGGLIVAPLLAHMGTGLIGGKVYERRAAELYAADAGVEDAVWKIQHGKVSVCPGQPNEPPFNISVNGKDVEVTITYVTNTTNTVTYFVQSIATGDGSGTTIEAYLSVSYLDLSALLDNALVSQDTITIKSRTVVNGDIWLPDSDDLDNKGTINGEVKDSSNMTITLPTFDQLSGVYWEDVAHLETEAYPDGYVINIPPGTTEGDPYVIGPLLAAGALTIKGDGWIKLDGTIYVKGTLFTNPTPEIHIALEGHTIFAEGDINLNPGVWLHGSGCVIARYDIDFQPNLDTEGENFVLVLSLEGEVQFKPGNSFTGCIAGNVDVELLPGSTISWISPEGKGLDFPMGVGDDDELPPVAGLSIESWEIEQH